MPRRPQYEVTDLSVDQVLASQEKLYFIQERNRLSSSSSTTSTNTNTATNLKNDNKSSNSSSNHNHFLKFASSTSSSTPNTDTDTDNNNRKATAAVVATDITTAATTSDSAYDVSEDMFVIAMPGVSDNIMFL